MVATDSPMTGGMDDTRVDVADEETQSPPFEDLYSQQIYVYGIEAMRRIDASSVLVIGARGVGAEAGACAGAGAGAGSILCLSNE
jgi:tRNA A37 threonylcarbamoyladenosine dehydratase